MKSGVRNFLRKRGHLLKPVVMVGRLGLDNRVVQAVDEALDAHELIKVKFQAHHDEIRQISEQIATSVKAEVVTIVGHITLLFRQNKNQEDRMIHIPKNLSQD